MSSSLCLSSMFFFFFFSSRRRHTRLQGDWSSDVCSSDLVALDKVNVGAWFGKQFSKLVKAEKVLVQKSGYFARSAPANATDLALIQRCVDEAVSCSLRGESGLIGEDEEPGDKLRAIQ